MTDHLAETSQALRDQYDAARASLAAEIQSVKSQSDEWQRTAQAEIRASQERVRELEAKVAAWEPTVVAAERLRVAKTHEYYDAALGVIANATAIPPALRPKKEGT